MNKPLYIIGAGGHATSLAEIAFASNRNLIAFISPNSNRTELVGLPILASIPSDIDISAINLAIAIGDNFLREQTFKQLNFRFPIESFPSLIHPSASVARKSTIGYGSTVHQNSTVGCNSVIGSFCILNSGSNVDHDCNLADFSSLGPGVNLGGGVTVGYRAVVGIGSTVRHGVSIATDSILGANSYAHTSTQEQTVSIGSPAKVIRNRHTGENYL